MISAFNELLLINPQAVLYEQILPTIIAVGFYMAVIVKSRDAWRAFDWEQLFPSLLTVVLAIGSMQLIKKLGLKQDNTDIYQLATILVYLIVLCFIINALSRHYMSDRFYGLVSICMSIWAVVIAYPFVRTYLDTFPEFKTFVDFISIFVDQAFVYWNAINPFPHMTFIRDFMHMLPYLINAFAFVGVWISLISIFAIRYRTTLYWSFKTIFSFILLLPYLTLRYTRSETPFADYFIRSWSLGRVKNSITDTQKNSSKKDTKNTQSAANLEQKEELQDFYASVRRAKVTVLTANGERKVRIRFKLPVNPKYSESAITRLKPIGKSLRFRNVRFPDEPTRLSDYLIFESAIPYRAGERATMTLSELFSPWWIKNDDPTRKDETVWKNLRLQKTLWADALTGLTPPGLYNRMTDQIRRTYSVDTSIIKAKYPVVHQILNYKLFPDKSDEIKRVKEKAVSVAEKRQQYIENALIKKYGSSFSTLPIKISGSTAIYRYDFPQVIDFSSRTLKTIQLALNTKAQLDFTFQGRELDIMVPNGIGLDDPKSIIVPTSMVDMLQKMPKNPKEFVACISGIKADGSPAVIELGDSNPHLFTFGKTGSGKTVTIMNLIFSMWNIRTPSELKNIFIDGKGNSFEFLKGNPYLMFDPADGSGDIEYARALIAKVEDIVRERIDVFKKAGVSKLKEYNKKYPDQALPRIVVTVDEFSAITDKDDELSGSKSLKFKTEPRIEYIAKMARSAGVILIMANQTARSEKVRGTIKANITAYLALMMSQPIESAIALPEAEEKPHLLNTQGDHYLEMNGPTNIERAQSPYMDDDLLDAVNEDLIEQFGHGDLFMERDEVVKDLYGDENEDNIDASRVTLATGRTKKRAS